MLYKGKWGAGDMAQQSRACTVLTEDPNLLLSTHTGGLITACNPSSRTEIMRLNRTWVWYSSCFQFKNVLKIKNALKEWELKMVMHLWITKILVLVLLPASPLFYIKCRPFRVTDPEIHIPNLWKAYSRMVQVMDCRSPLMFALINCVILSKVFNFLEAHSSFERKPSS